MVVGFTLASTSSAVATEYAVTAGPDTPAYWDTLATLRQHFGQSDLAHQATRRAAQLRGQPGSA